MRCRLDDEEQRKKHVADVVGHVPQEISRFVYIFLHHVRSIDAVVEDEKYRQKRNLFVKATKIFLSSDIKND